MEFLLMLLNSFGETVVKKVDALHINGEYFISIHEIEPNEVIVELSLAYHTENTALKEEIIVLKQRLHLLGDYDHNNNLKVLE